MPAAVIELADAVVSVLNNNALSLPFVAKRDYVPAYCRQAEEGDVDELLDLTVSVLVRRQTPEPMTRGKTDYVFIADVCVFKRMPEDEEDLEDDDELTARERMKVFCDPLMLLVEEILGLFDTDDQAIIAALAPARLMTLDNDPIYDPKLLDEHKLFASRVSLTFRRDRDK